MIARPPVNVRWRYEPSMQMAFEQKKKKEAAWRAFS